MTNNRVGRDKQARDAERRQNEREIATERERGDEIEPPVDGEELVALEAALDGLIFPATGAEVVATVGNHRIESVEGSYRLEDPSRTPTRKRSTLLVPSGCRYGDRQLPR